MDVNDDYIVIINKNPAADTMVGTSKSKRPRILSVGSSATIFWQQFANDPKPLRFKSAGGKPCCSRYNHSKKREQAMMHLNDCHAFTRQGLELRITVRMIAPNGAWDAHHVNLGFFITEDLKTEYSHKQCKWLSATLIHTSMKSIKSGGM
jgi:hypothetical protein